MHRFMTRKLVNENGSAMDEFCYKSKRTIVLSFTDIYIERDNDVYGRMSITKVKNSPEN